MGICSDGFIIDRLIVENIFGIIGLEVLKELSIYDENEVHLRYSKQTNKLLGVE